MEQGMGHGRLELCPPMRTASVEALIGRGLKSLFCDALSEPLPESFLRALRTLERLTSAEGADPLSRDDKMADGRNA